MNRHSDRSIFRYTAILVLQTPMDPSIVGHYIGGLGELFNLAGAVVLALDLLRRREEQRALRNAETLARFVTKIGIKGSVYKGLDPADPNFATQLAARSATRLGVAGIALLAIGFVLLLTYHGIEIWDLGKVERPSKFSLTRESEYRKIIKEARKWHDPSSHESLISS